MSELAINIVSKSSGSGFNDSEAGLNRVDKAAKTATASLAGIGKNLTNVGKGLTATVTLPLLGIGAAAIKAGVDLNRGMANVASLGVATARVNELKTAVQDMAIATGKSTDDLAGGLYQVVSAFGDTKDTAKILEINARAAAAGLAETTDSINLTSAVTKAFGDTSATAVQHVTDLALKSVELGQTTFPELAGSIGIVAPLAKTMGISLDEMFAVMATGSGVTGTTSQVATQFRGIIQSLMAPTDTMTKLLHSMGIANGAAMLQQYGLEKSIQIVIAASDRSKIPLQQFIGSIEGQTLALALAGPQAEQYIKNLGGLQDATGKTDAAFKAQTEGVNALGFKMQQAQVKITVFLQKISDAMGPALLAVADAITPLGDKLLALADKFQQLDPTTQKWIVGIAAAAAAIGPLLIGVGMMLPALEGMGAALGMLVSPLALVAAGLGVLVYYNFDSIKEFSTTILGGIVAAAPSAGAALGELVAQLTGIGINANDTTEGIQAFVTALTGSSSAGEAAATWVFDLGTSLQGLQTALPLTAGAFGEIVAQLTGLGSNTYDTVENITAFVAALTGSQSAGVAFADSVTAMGTTLSTAFGGPLVRLQDSFSTFGTSLGTLSPQFAALGTAIVGLWTSAQPALTALGQLIAVSFGASAIISLNFLSATFQNLGSIIGAAVGEITAVINLLSTTISGMTTIVASLLTGDFAGAWTGAQTVVGGFATFVSSTLGNVETAVTGALSIIKTTISTSLASLGFPEIATQIDAISAKVSGGWLSIKDSVTITVASFKWSDYVKAFVWPIVTWSGWSTFVNKLTWPNIVWVGWSAYVKAMVWPIIAWAGWSEFIKQLEWPKITWDSWTGFVDKLEWPVISWDGWSSFIPKFPGWPDIKSIVSSAVGSIPGTGVISGAYNYITGGSDPSKHADGTGGFAGGWSWVGERGPELMKLPRGTQIMSNFESSKYIANNAAGTTTAPPSAAGLGLGGAQAAGFNAFVNSANKALDTGAKKMQAAIEKGAQALEGALSKVPGLFGTSEVTQKQLDMAKLGIPQNFADDYIRHLTDTVMNGKGWDGVDIKDAAMRAGIDPGLPAKVILDMVKEQWNDQSFFAGGKNTELINLDAVKAEIAKQQAQASGHASIMALFGIKSEDVTAQGGQLVDLLNQGIAGGMAGSGKGKDGKAQGNGIGTAIVAGAVADIKDSKVDAGGQLASALSAQLSGSTAFAGTGSTILQAIVDSWADATKSVDMLGGIADALKIQVDSKDSVELLKNVGGRIAILLKQGIDDFFESSSVAESVSKSVNKSTGTTDTPPIPAHNAIGTNWFAGGSTWIGETEPELITLPRGSSITPRSQVATGDNITVNVYAQVNNEIDMNSMAYKIATIIQRKK